MRKDQYYVEYDRNHILTSCSVRSIDKNALEAKGELVGIHKLSNTFYRRMCADYATILESQPKLGYESELLSMSLYKIMFRFPCPCAQGGGS